MAAKKMSTGASSAGRSGKAATPTKRTQTGRSGMGSARSSTGRKANAEANTLYKKVVGLEGHITAKQIKQGWSESPGLMEEIILSEVNKKTAAKKKKK